MDDPKASLGIVMRILSCLTGDHNLWLVGVAAALCLLGSLVTMRLFQRLRYAEKGARAAWTFMGAVAPEPPSGAPISSP